MAHSPPALPSFIVIGAVKAATTWISHQLRRHPALWLPDAEPHFFSSEYARGIEWYQGLFAAAPHDRKIGEKSADYFAHPDAAGRIAAILPGVPLILQLRDPVERAYSDYCMLFRRGLVSANPRQHLDRARAGDSRFLDGGLYARHFERLVRHIPRHQIAVFLYEDIKNDPAAVINQVCDHIGVETHIDSTAAGSRQNDGTAPMLSLRMRRALRPLRPWLDPLRSTPIFARMRASMARPVTYPPLSPELRETLLDFYREDILRLEDLIGRDLSCWYDAPVKTRLSASG